MPRFENAMQTIISVTFPTDFLLIGCCFVMVRMSASLLERHVDRGEFDEG